MEKSETLLLGIDDAGRGPVIGPMIVAGCLMDKKTQKELQKIGVDDSKKLTQKRREFLEEKIKEKVISYDLILITPSEIDGDGEARMKLNELEGNAFAKIIDKLNKEEKRIRVTVDCPSVSLKKFEDYLKTKIDILRNLEISCEHKADKNHVCVAAASILAKCEREREIEKIKKKYGDEVGSGYTSDPLTKKFVEKYAEKYGKDGIFRKTWVTWQKAYNNLNQKKLF